MKNLTDAMGISSPSLYATFGDKRQLYLKAIRHYAANVGCKSLEAFEKEPDIAKAVRAFVKTTINIVAAHESGARGCLLASCVETSAGEVDDADKYMLQFIRDSDKRIAARFDAERSNGVLPKDFPSLPRARLMFDCRLGLAFRARAGIGYDTLTEDIDHQVTSILSPA